MYYKITNQDCDVYQKLRELRQNEVRIKEENEVAIKEKTGLDYEVYFGDYSQQNFRRVPQYTGFNFIETDKVDLKVWQIHKEYKNTFIPNRKTKLGREMSDFLLNGLKGSAFTRVFEILKVKDSSRYKLPFVEIIDEVIVIFLDDSHEPDDENVIEITKKEFNGYFEKQTA